MSLAEELLADLEELDDVHPLPSEDNEQVFASAVPDEGLKVVKIHELAKLRYSDNLLRVMKEIECYQNKSNSSNSVENPNTESEYLLIVEANNIAAEIDDEILIIRGFVRDKYCKRFPELESLVVNPLEYIMTVKELGNDLDRAKTNDNLPKILSQATIMVVSVTASTTQGKMLTAEELEEILEACNVAIELDSFKSQIYEYVESRMTFVAPNLTVIVGASTAAKMIGVAGGLSNLSKMAACNVQLLGSQKRTLSGFSRVAALPHTGFVYDCPIVQDMPPDFRKKAARIVAAKSTLAARVDVSQESKDGRIGRVLREEIEKKFDKMTEPPPVKFAKPLPKPIDAPKKRRGGKRVRKMKERYAVTEMRKQANRLNFGDIDDDAYQEDLGYNRGTIGKSGTGKVRVAQVDEKTKVRISKTLQKNLQKQQVWGGSTSVRKQVSGTTSSVAFTPSQGLEIVNPQAAEKNAPDTSAKYFSNVSGFVKVKRNGTN